MTLTPDQLREAADLLCKNSGLYFNDAAAKLRGEADRMERSTAEAQLNFDVGDHWMRHMETKYKWSITCAGRKEREKFGEAALAAVKAHTNAVYIGSGGAKK